MLSSSSPLLFLPFSFQWPYEHHVFLWKERRQYEHFSWIACLQRWETHWFPQMGEFIIVCWWVSCMDYSNATKFLGPFIPIQNAKLTMVKTHLSMFKSTLNTYLIWFWMVFNRQFFWKKPLIIIWTIVIIVGKHDMCLGIAFV